MGCLQSKKVSSDLHPNVFRVMNIDESGNDLCSGQLEITDSDIILYREGRDSTVWPLHSLRRYGFEGEVFSFESGRRCDTGEGIYGFRCRRASLMFRTLQQQIQLRNIIHGAVQFPISRMTPSPQSRQTLHANVIHRSSIDNGQPISDALRPSNNLSVIAQGSAQRHVNHSHRSLSSAEILEVMPLYPRNQPTTTHATNVYQVRDFKREHNNNQAEAGLDTRHVYTNDLNRDLAILRNTLRQETALNTMRDIEDETRFLENRYVNEDEAPLNNIAKNPLSPTLSSTSEHYAQLTLEQQVSAQEATESSKETAKESSSELAKDSIRELTQEPVINITRESTRPYMNIGLNDTILPEIIKNPKPPLTPSTPKQAEYSNILLGIKPDIISYANLTIGEFGDSIKNAQQLLGSSVFIEHSQKFFESDNFRSMSPVEELEVNYAILDIDSNKDATKITSPESKNYNRSKSESTASCLSQTGGRLKSQCSIEKGTVNINASNIGYTTIDFDKTVALTSVAACNDIDVDGVRKPRHNSCHIVCGSPSSGDKYKTFG